MLGTQRVYELPTLIKRIENGERIVSVDEKPFEESEIQVNRVKSVRPGFRLWKAVIIFVHTV